MKNANIQEVSKERLKADIQKGLILGKNLDSDNFQPVSLNSKRSSARLCLSEDLINSSFAYSDENDMNIINLVLSDCSSIELMYKSNVVQYN